MDTVINLVQKADCEEDISQTKHRARMLEIKGGGGGDTATIATGEANKRVDVVEGLKKNMRFSDEISKQ